MGVDMMQGNHFSKLSAFVAVAEHRHFSKAAAQLGISPSTLTKAIRALEEHLGVRLLNRTTRSVSLTAAGEQLLHHMQPVMGAINDALDAMNNFRDNPRGTLRLSILRAVAISIIAPLVPAFLREYPDIALEIVTDDSDADIIRDRIDAGIRVGECIEKDMVAVRIFDEYRMVTVASPEYVAKHPAISAPEDLRAHNCIQRRWAKDGAIHPWEFESNGRRSQVVVGGSLVVNDPYLIRQAAIDGVGIANLAEMMVAAAISERKLVPLLRDWEPRMSGLFLYYSSRRQVPAPLRAFIAFMRRHKNAVRSDQIAQPGPADDQMISSQPRSALFGGEIEMCIARGAGFEPDETEAAHDASALWRAVASSGFLAHPDALHMQRAPFAEGCQRRIKRLAKRRERVLNARRNFPEIPSLNNAIRLHFLEMLDQHFLADPRHQTPQFSETVRLRPQRPQNQHLPFPADHVERCLQATKIVLLSHYNAPASLLTAR